jgi:hypothetical protein
MMSREWRATESGAFSKHRTYFFEINGAYFFETQRLLLRADEEIFQILFVQISITR